MKTTLHSTKNDLRERVRRAMVDLLNQNLADVVDLGLQAKQAHWKVKGPHFIALHELFDKVAEELEEFSDDIAERAVALGGVALGTSQVIAKQSRLSIFPTNLTRGEDHIEAMASQLAEFGKSVTVEWTRTQRVVQLTSCAERCDREFCRSKPECLFGN